MYEIGWMILYEYGYIYTPYIYLFISNHHVKLLPRLVSTVSAHNAWMAPLSTCHGLHVAMYPADRSLFHAVYPPVVEKRVRDLHSNQGASLRATA